MLNTAKNSTAFQVVLIVESNSLNFGRLTKDIPECLLHVTNRPIISFQLEMLELAGFNGERK